jgi:hypothetical protein
MNEWLIDWLIDCGLLRSYTCIYFLASLHEWLHEKFKGSWKDWLLYEWNDWKRVSELINVSLCLLKRHTIKTLESGGIATSILSGNKWRRATSFTTPAALLREKNPTVYWIQVGPYAVEIRNISAPYKNRPLFPGLPVSSLITTLTGVSWLRSHH